MTRASTTAGLHDRTAPPPDPGPVIAGTTGEFIKQLVKQECANVPVMSEEEFTSELGRVRYTGLKARYDLAREIEIAWNAQQEANARGVR